MYEKTVTKGVVLRETQTKEADKILTVLTPERGKLAVIARGARRKGSKIAAASELLAFSELVLYQRGSWYYLDEASTITLFGRLRTDIELLALASYFAEMTEAVSAEEMPAGFCRSCSIRSTRWTACKSHSLRSRRCSSSSSSRFPAMSRW